MSGLVKAIRILLALLVPPYMVWRLKGPGRTLLLNVVLTLLGYVLGSIHGAWVWLKASSEERSHWY